MWKRISKYFKGWFSGGFVHPVLNEKLNTAIDDKINAVKNKQSELSQKHTDLLNSYLRTYFSKEYSSTEEMAIAFDVSNKAWKKHCRTINSTEKLINLNKDAFANQVMAVVKHMKNNEKEKKTEQLK